MQSRAFHVDDREPAPFRRRLVALGATVRRLSDGDVQAGEYLLERKAVGDFLASLHDGRLFVQAAGLRASGLRPVLALEGPLEVDERGRAALHGALASVVLRLGVPVVPTTCMDGTAALARSLLRRTHAVEADVDEPVVKLRRLDPYVAALAQVPGVGARRAADLASRHPSFADLAGLRFTDLVDETGPKTAEALWRVLHGRDVPEVYRRLGTGKRARALVARYPALERGEAVDLAAARAVVGPSAAARLGDLARAPRVRLLEA